MFYHSITEFVFNFFGEAVNARCWQKPIGFLLRGGTNRIGRREKWPKKSWEEGEIRGKSREEGEKET